jgi:hypothetical protein
MTAPASIHDEIREHVGVLTRQHRYQLEVESAILPEVIAEEDIRSMPTSLGLPTPDPALRHPNTHKGQYFGIWGETDDQYRPIDLGAGLWFGTRDANGRLIGSYKPDCPRTARNGHIVKYEGCRGTRPGGGVPRRCVEALVNSLCEVFFTEGFKKALALASAGACAVALAGVDSWMVKPSPDAPSEPVEDFDAIRWHGRIVWIVYDSDAVTKDGVRWAERRLTREFESRGAIVVVLRIPHRPDGSKRGIDDYIADRLVAGVTREDALCELKGPALAELVRLSRLRREPVTSTDDEDDDPAGRAALAEEVRTHKAEMELIRRGPVPTAEALAIGHLVSVSHGARVRGESVVPLYVPADAQAAGVGGRSMTRALNQVRRWQEDPETAVALSFRIEDEYRDGKQHVRLRVLPTPDQDGAGWTKAREYRAIARLPRDEDRGRHGGARIACPKHPDTEIARTTIWRCTADECTWVHQESATLGRRQDGAGEPDDVVTMHGAPFATTVQGRESRRQDGADRVPTDVPRQDGAGEPRTLIPVSFTSRDDMVAAAGPRYWGEAPPAEPEPPPEPKPLPVAPHSHIARAFRLRRPPAAAGGGS